VSHINSEKQLRVQSFYTQSTRNSACNSSLGIRRIFILYQMVRAMGIARLFACKVQTHYAQFEAEELDAVIRLPVRCTQTGATTHRQAQTGQNLEVLGYGE